MMCHLLVPDNIHDVSLIPDSLESMNSPRWLDADEQRAWRAYLRMQGRLTARLNRQLQADSGLSLADYDVLVHLTDHEEGRLRPYELQRDLQWEQSRLRRTSSPGCSAAGSSGGRSAPTTAAARTS